MRLDGLELLLALAACMTALSCTSAAAPIALRIDMLPVEPIPAAAGIDSTYFDPTSELDSGDDDDDDDDDDDSGLDLGIDSDGIHVRTGSPPAQQFSLAKQWRVLPADDHSQPLAGTMLGGSGFDLELAMPGQVFVHALRDDPDYATERRAPYSSSLVAKVVAVANDAQLLEAIQVEQIASGLSIATTSPPTATASDIVVYVYVRIDRSSPLQRVVSTGAGDVVLTKRVVARTLQSFAVASHGGSRVFIHTSDALSYMALSLDAAGGSRLYLHVSDSLSITDKLTMQVDDNSSIVVRADHVTTTTLASRVQSGGSVCVQTDHLQASAVTTDVVRNGTVTIRSDSASCNTLAVTVTGAGTVDCGALVTMNARVVIDDGDGDVTIGPSVHLEYAAPSTAHVRYRSHSPTVVTTTTVDAPPLERASSSSSLKCRNVASPNEPRAVSLVGRTAADASNLSPSPSTLSPASDAPRDGSIRVQVPWGELVIPQDAGDGASSWKASGGVGNPSAYSIPPEFASPVAPTLGQTENPQVSPPHPSSSPHSTPPLPPSPTPDASAKAAAAEGPTPLTGATPSEINDTVYFQIAAVVGCFLWLLHQVLRCCDQRSRRREYESISGARAARNSDNDDIDPPVRI